MQHMQQQIWRIVGMANRVLVDQSSMERAGKVLISAHNHLRPWSCPHKLAGFRVRLLTDWLRSKATEERNAYLLEEFAPGSRRFELQASAYDLIDVGRCAGQLHSILYGNEAELARRVEERQDGTKPGHLPCSEQSCVA